MPVSADTGQDVAEAQQRIDAILTEAELAAQPALGWGELLDSAERVAQAEIAYARVDPRMFIPYVMHDERTGASLVQQPMHDEWQRLANEHDRLILWAGIELGKTQALSVGRTLWLLGCDPSARIVVVSNTYNQSAKIVRAISDYIEKSDALHRVFPGLQPDKSSGWTTHSLTVKRSIISKDPSLQTCGVHGNIQGARIDYLILDDVLDYENTRTAEGRQDLCDWYHSALAGRLTEHARVIIVGTAFHPDDLLHRLAKTPAWSSFRFPVADENGVSVWPERWPPERIAAKRAEFGPLEAARQMFCVARDDAQARFKREWIDIGLRRGEGKKFVYALDARSTPPGCVTYTGVDLAVQQHSAADLTVMFTIMVYPNEDREIICIESGRWAGPEILNRIVDTHRRYNSQIIVENNAAQDYIVQMLHSSTAIPVRGYTTGRNKAHPEYGVEHLASELAAGKWIIPCENGRMHPEIEAWINELLFYDPALHTGDRVMAGWLAKEGIRMGSIVAERGRLDLLRR